MEKTYSLEILAPARAELLEIARLHMALVGPQSARKITEDIREALNLLRYQPYMGTVFQDKELSRDGYRKLICGNYLCVYRPIADTVYVYHIVDGRTDYPKLLSGSL